MLFRSEIVAALSSGRALTLADNRSVSLGETIGRGSTATVYRGILEGSYRVRRPVAVKVLDTLTSEDRDVVVTALARAARHAACVDHPNVVATYEFNVNRETQPFIVTELVEGKALGELMEAFVAVNRRVPLDLALFIATEVAEGLTGARAVRCVRKGAGRRHPCCRESR